MRPARTFTDFIPAQVEKSDPHRININKFRSREIAAAASVATPQLYAVYKTPREIDFAALPDRCVLKPSDRCSRRGVHLLQRAELGFYDLLSRSNLNEDDVIARLEKVTTANVIAEELLPGPTGPRSIPLDYKFYAFGDSIPMIQQTDRNGEMTELSFFDGSFGELAPGNIQSKWTICRPGTPVVPKNAKDMIEAARSVARHLGRPFIRIDLYTDDERIWLGEATPAPGEAYYGNYFCFSPEFDLALGEHWSRGHERVGWEVPILRTEPPRRGRPKSVAASQLGAGARSGLAGFGSTFMRQMPAFTPSSRRGTGVYVLLTLLGHHGLR